MRIKATPSPTILDLNDPKIALIHGALVEVLGNQDASKITQYFTDDANMIINEKRLSGYKAIHDRISWVKNNVGSVTVKLHNAFFQGDQGFDYHTTEAIDKEGNRSLYKIFGYIKLRDGKICHYEDVTIQIEGGEAMNAVTSTNAQNTRS